MNRHGRIASGVALAACGLLLQAPVQGQEYPARPVRFVVPFGAGGPGDQIARVMGKQYSEGMRQPVVVDIRAGASTIIGSEIVARAPADGYTMLLISTTHSVNPSLFRKLPYDPVKDFAPVTLITSTPFMLAVPASLPVNSLADLAALARSKPKQLNYGSSGNGSSIHLTSVLFDTAAKVEMTHVPYKGAGPAFIDLIGGQIQVLFSSTVSTLPHVRTGKVKGLAVTSLRRAQALPDVPAVSETFPGFESSSWFGLLLPARSPQAAIDRLVSETRTALKSAEVAQSLISQGGEPGGMSPAEFSAYYQGEIRKWGEVIRAAGIKPED